MASTIEMMDIIVARVPERRQERFWTARRKRRIVAEARADGASVAAVARRHHLDADLRFTRIRDRRFVEDVSAYRPVDQENLRIHRQGPDACP